MTKNQRIDKIFNNAIGVILGKIESKVEKEIVFEVKDSLYTLKRYVKEDLGGNEELNQQNDNFEILDSIKHSLIKIGEYIKEDLNKAETLKLVKKLKQT